MFYVEIWNYETVGCPLALYCLLFWIKYFAIQYINERGMRRGNITRVENIYKYNYIPTTWLKLNCSAFIYLQFAMYARITFWSGQRSWTPVDQSMFRRSGILLYISVKNHHISSKTKEYTHKNHIITVWFKKIKCYLCLSERKHS